ncbi:MAG TPA: endonuclease/exonuclease/phosphatase family protein [Gemmatimonadales bacterium]|jgi:endonuclease/exonuclease/phosphatase family metal-dependent hydrolase
MRVTTHILAAAALCLATACADRSPSEPSSSLEVGADQGRSAKHAEKASATVMTRNLYVGTDVDAVIGAIQTPATDDDLPALLAAIETLRQTDFPSRAAAIADEIARARPHVVGLQEVSQIDLTLPPLGIDIHQNFLPTLLGELSERGLEYAVAAQVRNIEAAPFPGVTLVDYDAILVDTRRVQLQSTTARNFTANLGQVAPGVVLRRGWVSASGLIGGVSFTFASTHLESGGFPGLDQLRAAQASELVQALAGSTRLILLGDLNDVPGSLMYQVLTGAGLEDVWADLRPRNPGNTCCHLTDLSNVAANFSKRIDYVFLRDAGLKHDRVAGKITRVGDAPRERVSGPEHLVWASDHAGLVARLRVREAAD